jgi:hypothetical protein
VPAQYKTELLTIEIEPAREALCGLTTPKDLKLARGEQVADSIGGVRIEAKCVTIPVQKEIAPATIKKIQVPALTKTVPVRKLKTPARVEEVAIAAIEKEIPVENCVAEECVKYRPVPAEYQCLRRLQLVEPATTERVEVPAKVQTFKRNKLVNPAQMVWRQISISKCKTVADACAKYGTLPATGARKN